MRKSLLCISKKHVKVYSRSLLFTMLTQQQISKTINKMKTEGRKKKCRLRKLNANQLLSPNS
jgi:hypothetical protein